MSLFVVNRYVGDEAEGTVEDGEGVEENVEKKRLKQLLKKAKVRKSLRSSGLTTSDGGEIPKDEEEAGQNDGGRSKGKKRVEKEENGKGPDKKKRKKQLETEGVEGGSEVAPPKESKESEGIKEDVTDKNKAKKISRKLKRKASKAKKKAALSQTELGVDVGGFTVIGDVNQFRQQTVKRVLPDWLTNPFIISNNLKDDKVPVTSFGLDNQIVHTLQQNFIHYFFPVQQQVIPWLISHHDPKVLRPSDICVSASTGSGKTLAYALPIIHILKKTRIYPCVRAIVVLPTEMLATQVYSVFKNYSNNVGLSVFLMTKRLTFSAERDALVKCGIGGRLNTPFDIIIATPGRLIDHLEQTEGFDISQLQFLIVDEADRTLDDQEGDWLQRLENKFWASHSLGINQPWKSLPLTVKWLPVHRKAFQKLLFSATLSQNPESLEKLHLFEPKLFTAVIDRKQKPNTNAESGIISTADDISNANVEEVNLSDGFVGKYSTPTELMESFVLCKKETKPLVLTYLISNFKWKRVLCFANTKENTHRLCLLLKFMGHLNVREISGKWTPKTRDVVIKKFVNGAIDILVTSDQMARGIDIPQVDHVISYDLPGYTKTYIHRIGRCARAGREGKAVCLVNQEQIGIYKKTMKQTGKTNFVKIPVKNSDLRPLESSFKEALGKLKDEVEDQRKSKTSSSASASQPKVQASEEEIVE